MKKISLYTLLISLVISCTESSEHKNQFDNFKLENVKCEATFSEEFNQKLIFGAVYQQIFMDSCIIALDQAQDEFVTILDLRTNEIIRTGTNGKGPNELIMPMTLVKSKHCAKCFELYDFIHKAVFAFNLDSCIARKGNYLPTKITTSFKEGFKYISGNKNTFIGSGVFESTYRFATFNVEDNKFNYDSENVFDFDNSDKNENIFKALAYQGQMRIIDKKMVWVCSNTPFLEIYSIDKNSLIKEKSLRYGTVKYVADRAGGGYGSAIKGGNQMGFRSIDVDADYIYTLYSGKVVTKGNTGSITYSDKLLIFDWEGNFVKGYKLSEAVTCISKNSNNNIIYGFSALEGKIIQFEI
ncbi:BF3164 family lipoprotein [Chondrinema litorale]|uniref:BF3164 family lipoprotein n=1 Tax=Chondrinema litorale TaxID=2994555 RepID=UPI002543312E|nr:BF3164 family lipoprotein [Chondrinema litorale]UZR98571.1 BF3164 family lipoprotein [Chondrinema litorale]